MTPLSDPQPPQGATPGGADARAAVVYYDEPPIKPPPNLVAGPLAWARDNLFSTPTNALLTLIAGALTIGAVAGIVNWAVSQGNWYIIIFNLRQFMVGRYEPEAEWRVVLTSLIAAFIFGFALASWARVSRRTALLLVALIALVFVIPLIAAALPLPPTYLSASADDIASGSSTQPPVDQFAFIARGGETLRLELAVDLSAGDADLQTLHSFADPGANLLRAAAFNRLRDQARVAEIERLLAEDAPNARTLTANQRAALETERGRLEVSDPITETFALNQTPQSYRLLRGTTQEIVAEGVLEAGSAPVEIALPEDGWYILEKPGEGTALIRVYGIYPHLERTFTRSETVDETGTTTQSAGRFSQFVRLTDEFTTEETRPRIDGDNVPMAIIIDLQYRGDRTPADWLMLYVGPFLDGVNDALLWMLVAGVVGYYAARAADRYLPSKRKGRSARAVSQRFSTWMLSALPFIIFLLIYGFGSVLPITDTRRWGGLMLTIMLTMVGVLASFPLGVLLALGRRSALPAIRVASTLYIEFVRGVPLITVLFMAQLLVPLVNPSLAEVDNVFRAMVGILLFSAAYLAENVRGGLQAVPHGQEEAAKALGLAGWQVTLLITLPQALRYVIPALVGQFISLFKDTSLVAIVGLLDLTGIARSTVAQTEFLGLYREVYLFIGILYFVFSYVMAAISRRLEASGSGAARRV